MGEISVSMKFLHMIVQLFGDYWEVVVLIGAEGAFHEIDFDLVYRDPMHCTEIINRIVTFELSS